MSYSLVHVPRENYLRVITNASPLYVPMGALSAADATTLRVGVVVGAFAGVAAALSFEESVDAGATWQTVTGVVSDTVSGLGTFEIAVSAANGPLSPLVRLKILPDAATTVRLSNLYKTFVQSSVMVPRDTAIPTGLATETTLQSVLTQATAAAAAAAATAISAAAIDVDTSAIAASVASIDTTTDAINTQITNFSRNTGAADATTLRSVLATRHETVTTPLAGRLSDGIDFIVAVALAAAQTTFGAVTKALHTVSVVCGWDSTNSVHREIAVSATGQVSASNADITSKLAGSFVNVAYDSAYSDYTGATADVWTYKLSGTTVKTVTITYSGTDKATITSIVAV